MKLLLLLRRIIHWVNFQMVGRGYKETHPPYWPWWPWQVCLSFLSTEPTLSSVTKRPQYLLVNKHLLSSIRNHSKPSLYTCDLNFIVTTYEVCTLIVPIFHRRKMSLSLNNLLWVIHTGNSDAWTQTAWWKSENVSDTTLNPTFVRLLTEGLVFLNIYHHCQLPHLRKTGYPTGIKYQKNVWGNDDNS